jgi:alkanesulfonate monooxygenase SsuD/methylene tetrahydromethanopterin reductase-like flavin-dependent oxidoreductase (luciferase family)
MKFGILFELETGEPFSGARERQVTDEAVAQTRLADQLGWEYVWAVEHHFLTGFASCASPEVFLGYLASVTEQIRIGHAVVHCHPTVNHFWRIAERAGMLDVLSDGRLELGTGRGFSPGEIVGFNADPALTRPAQIEVIKMLQEVWLDDTFAWDGEYYQLPEKSVHPKPVQEPHPPLWMACTQPASWDVAAELGVGVLSFGTDHGADGMRQKVETYRAKIADVTTKAGVVNNQVVYNTAAFCADSDEEAVKIATSAPRVFWSEGR